MSALATLQPTPIIPARPMPGCVVCPTCGRTAEVAYRYVLPSSHGPVQHIRPL